MGLSKLGLDELLQICFCYSCKWRYEYGPLKCSVILFNETRGQFLKSNTNWLLGPHTINMVKEEESYKYLGIMFSKYMSLKANIKDVSAKLKGTFASPVNNDIIHLFTRTASIPAPSNPPPPPKKKQQKTKKKKKTQMYCTAQSPAWL